jgi:hypothetical protein
MRGTDLLAILRLRLFWATQLPPWHFAIPMDREFPGERKDAEQIVAPTAALVFQQSGEAHAHA